MLCCQQAEQPAVDANGWFSTGDVATIDEHGFMAVWHCHVAYHERTA